MLVHPDLHISSSLRPCAIVNHRAVHLSDACASTQWSMCHQRSHTVLRRCWREGRYVWRERRNPLPAQAAPTPFPTVPVPEETLFPPPPFSSFKISCQPASPLVKYPAVSKPIAIDLGRRHNQLLCIFIYLYIKERRRHCVAL